jgi:hypothetical protein
MGAMGYAAGCNSRPEPPLATATEEVRTIALESIHSTSGQQGFKLVQRGQEPIAPYLERLWTKFNGVPSNVVLVRGDDLTTTLRSTMMAFTAARSTHKPVDPNDGSKPEQLWLVAHLGLAYSTPPAWLVESAEQRGKTLRLTFFEPVNGGATSDDHQYFYWVPLGKLQPGAYTLELFDSKKKAAMLSRLVIVD